MKVLHIIDTLGLGGAQTVVKGIMEAQKDNPDVFLYALRNKNDQYVVEHTNVIISTSTKLSLPLTSLYKLIRKENVDVLHCHLVKAQLAGFILKSLFFPKIKLIFHEHGKIFRNQATYIAFLKLAKSKVNFFISISEATKIRLIKHASIPDDKIRILYNFVDLDKFNRNNITHDIAAEREKLGYSKNDFVVGFAGRLVERKGWRDYVKAAVLLKDSPNIKFLIAGDGEQKDEMLALINELQLQDTVKHIGYVGDMIWFYSLLDCFVMPSHWEPMGLTHLEAQAMEVPVVATNVDGLTETVQSEVDCLLVSKKDSSAIVNQLKSIFERKDALVRNGLVNARRYGLDTYYRTLNEFYESS